VGVVFVVVFLLCFGGTWVSTVSLTLARQVLYYLSHASSPEQNLKRIPEGRREH
jgi:hypothetical protein